MRGVWAIVVLAFLGAESRAFADKVLDRIEVKTTPDKAWAAIGDFCGIKDWHPLVAGCEAEGEGNARMRTLTLKNGAKLVEKEVTWNDLGRSYVYKIVESSLPVENCTASIKVLPIDDARIHILWTSSFKPVGSAAAAQKAVSEIFVAGLKSLKAKLEAGPR